MKQKAKYLCYDRYFKFILVVNQLDAQNLFYNKFISCLYMFRAPCAHRQEAKIVLCSLWYHHTYRCDEFISCLYMFRAPCAHRQKAKIVLCSLWYHHTYRCIITPIGVMSLFHACTCFEHHVLIVRKPNCIMQTLVSSHL